jgi:hypothetical protein
MNPETKYSYEKRIKELTENNRDLECYRNALKSVNREAIARVAQGRTDMNVCIVFNIIASHCIFK